jgi:hypothetical protein
MAKYLTGRQKKLNLGIKNYSENLTSLEVIGKVGIGSTLPLSSLDVVGGSNIRGDLNITRNFDVNGISTFDGKVRIASNDPYALDVTGISTFQGKLSISSTTNAPVALEVFGDANFFNGTVGIKTAFIEGLSVTSIDIDVLNIGAATSITIGDSNGEDGQYLRSTGTGVTWASFPNLRTGFSTVGILSQTTVQTIYNTNFVDIFLNGVLLNSSEYTASNGIDIIFDQPLEGGEIVDVFSYNTVSTFSGGGGSTIVNLGGESNWIKNLSGIHTSSNVGIFTENPTSKLTVNGDGYFTGIVTASQFTTQTGGTPTITSPNNLNLNANTVAISTNLTVGNSVVANGGFVSLGSTTPVQIFVQGTKLIFSVVGIGSTSFTLY